MRWNRNHHPIWFEIGLLLCILWAGLAAQAQQSTTPASTDSAALPDAPATNVPVQLQPEGPTVVLDTSMGRMVCKLYSKEAPVATANFIGLATGSKDYTDPTTHKPVHGKPYYDGTTFHRVIPGFMIQGGDPTATGRGDPGYLFADEINPQLNFGSAGVLAMANSGPNTNGSQFFITVAPTPWLEGHYSIFGQCDDASVLVAQSITDVPRDPHDKPIDPVTLYKVTIVQNGQPLPPVPAAPQPAQTTAPAGNK
jgi:peptidyl-prolyl cis-trans isomerase A (cyclophilin A)